MGLRSWVAHTAIFIIAFFVSLVFSALLREIVSPELISEPCKGHILHSVRCHVPRRHRVPRKDKIAVLVCMTTVVHVRKAAYDIYIGRAFNESVWHNPFHLGKDGNRKEVLRKYREYILNRPDLMIRLSELKDKTLGCWCKPKFGCHGDVLADLADLAVLNS